MLPTNQKAKVGMINLEPYNREGHKLELIHYVTNGDGLSPQHLYILSDDEIKEGDWYYDEIIGISQKASDLRPELKLPRKKIIATTDTSLTILSTNSGRYVYQLPQSFIEKYVTEYNKGNIITDVLVEYVLEHDLRTSIKSEEFKEVPKINKDNTITIKKVKDSWTKEEILEFLPKAMKYACDKDSHLPHMFDLYANDWIEENL